LRGSQEPLQREKLAIFSDYENSGLAWFWATDCNGLLTYISEQAASSLGVTVDDILGEHFSALIDIESKPETEWTSLEPGGGKLSFLLRAKNTFKEKEVTIRLVEKEVWWSISGRPQFDSHGDFIGYRGNATDITFVRRERADATRLAQFDSLTGLANRFRMSNRLLSLLTAYKASNRNCALMMLDLDRFKQINDTLGHPTGDALLQQVAQRLKRIVGEKGEIGRLGGDEFQIILPNEDDRGELGSMANHIIQLLSQPYLIEGNSCVIGVSVGIAIFPYDGGSADELVRSADLSLYAAKEAGRGQFRYYSSELHSKAEERRQIEDEMRKALERGEFKVHYQPLTCPEENRVKGFEALLRWFHPERGMISPELFISVAEETGLIIPLGEWVLRQACEHAAGWPDDIRVAVNLSPVQFMTENLPGVLASALANAGLEPSRLELEITESVFLGDGEGTIKRFEIIKELGVRFALDDFGTGYSSLGYLQDAPFDKIKIDQSFIRGAVDGSVRGNAAIIDAIIGLARALKMETTAEGIEAGDELEFVRSRGVTTVQGYIYGEAVPNDDVLKMVKDGLIKLEPNGPSHARANRRAMLRSARVAFKNEQFNATILDISQTGARIKGPPGIPLGSKYVVDLGLGQLVVANVVRSEGYTQGVEFETPLVSDGGNGWCTRHRASAAEMKELGFAKSEPAFQPVSTPTASEEPEDPVPFALRNMTR
jgi:diguanylate cyclase (GGDEF)-like protein